MPMAKSLAALGLALLGLYLTPSALASGTDRGTSLYYRHCAACHGYDGQGGVGVPLSLPAFLSSVENAYLAKTIRVGRPGRVMPAFTQLSDDDINAIVGHMRRWQPQSVALSAKSDPISGQADNGKALYARHCTVCHGAAGEGGHGTGVTFSRPRGTPILAPALNNPGFLASASDQMIKTTLMQGRKGTPMTSFLKAGLLEADINDLVVFIRSFEQRPPPASARLLESESPILVKVSPYPVERTIEKVTTAVGAANLRLIRVQTLDQGFVKEGAENRDQTIIYSCDFPFLNEALKVDPRVGLFLPCRVTVVKHGNQVRVMAINPKRLSAIFNNSELNQLCEKMYEVYAAILEESTL